MDILVKVWFIFFTDVYRLTRLFFVAVDCECERDPGTWKVGTTVYDGKVTKLIDWINTVNA